jgi:hypothetical protein
MNIIFPIQNYDINNVFFLDSKRNIIMDGKFSKINYSDKNITLNGIFLNTPFHVKNFENIVNKYILKFDTFNETNMEISKKLIQIEKMLIDNYIITSSPKKRAFYLLREQLEFGSLKLYRDLNISNNNTSKPVYILKISGIWENNENIGLTYKFIEVYQFNFI